MGFLFSFYFIAFSVPTPPFLYFVTSAAETTNEVLSASAITSSRFIYSRLGYVTNIIALHAATLPLPAPVLLM